MWSEAQIEVKPDVDKVKADYKAKKKAALNVTPAYKRIGIMLDRWVLTNFKTEGGLVGGWKPFTYGGRVTTKKKGNAQSTANRRHIDGSAKLLQDTGVLRSSFVPFHTKYNVGIGSNIKYAPPHEEGIGHVPKRRMLPKDEDVRVKIKKILGDYIKGVFRK